MEKEKEMQQDSVQENKAAMLGQDKTNLPEHFSTFFSAKSIPSYFT